MKVIILAGGQATRLPFSAKKIPKVLVKIKNKPVLEWQLNLLQKYGFDNIRLSLGEKADQVIEFLKKKKYSVEYLIEKRPLQTGGAIKFAAKDLKEDFMVLNGDILTDLNLKKFLVFHQNKKAKNSLAVCWMKNSFSYGLTKIRKNGLVEKFLEKPKKPTAGYINSGFYIFSPKVFKKIKKRKFLVETEILPRLARQKELAAFIHRGQWIDMGTEERLNLARHYFRV